jgi:hypothetical protein
MFELWRLCDLHSVKEFGHVVMRTVPYAALLAPILESGFDGAVEAAAWIASSKWHRQ